MTLWLATGQDPNEIAVQIQFCVDFQVCFKIQPNHCDSCMEGYVLWKINSWVYYTFILVDNIW